MPGPCGTDRADTGLPSLLSDILPTGWMAAETCDIQPGDGVAFRCCGPVGLFAIQSALLMGAGQVIPMEQKVGIGTHRAHALRMALMAVRGGGHGSVPGVYGGMADKFPLGALMQKGVQIRTGQIHVQEYTRPLPHRILEEEIDTTFLISHRLSLGDTRQEARRDQGRADARRRERNWRSLNRTARRPQVAIRATVPVRNRVLWPATLWPPGMVLAVIGGAFRAMSP